MLDTQKRGLPLGDGSPSVLFQQTFGEGAYDLATAGLAAAFAGFFAAFLAFLAIWFLPVRICPGAWHYLIRKEPRQVHREVVKTDADQAAVPRGAQELPIQTPAAKTRHLLRSPERRTIGAACPCSGGVRS